MRLAPTLLLVIAALALAGCGGDESSSEPNPPAAGGTQLPEESQPPEDSPPGVMDGGPPPAWVATADGSRWLAYGTFCWTGGCADYAAPVCGEAHVPDIAVQEGERVSFHLDFEPTSASLTFFGEGDPEAVSLDAGEELTWTADRGGPFWLSTIGEPGDASYAGCVRYEPETLTVEEALARGDGEVAVTGTIYADGAEIRLCDGLAESYPPQCPSRFLTLEGFDLASAKNLSREGDITWGNEATTVRGTLRGSTLVVS